MTATLAVDDATWAAARDHLRGRVEQVGFFLADFDEPARCFRIRAFHALPETAFEIQSAVHVTLKDEVRPEVLGWATREAACLIEAHSHLWGPASFSGSDVYGFAAWVPHVRWRLRRRPYAAVVLAEATFDALAWINVGPTPEQVTTVEIGDCHLPATGGTLPRWAELERWSLRG
jgi:hypothetical protein